MLPLQTPCFQLPRHWFWLLQRPLKPPSQPLLWLFVPFLQPQLSVAAQERPAHVGTGQKGHLHRTHLRHCGPSSRRDQSLRAQSCGVPRRLSEKVPEPLRASRASSEHRRSLCDLCPTSHGYSGPRQRSLPCYSCRKTSGRHTTRQLHFWRQLTQSYVTVRALSVI